MSKHFDETQAKGQAAFLAQQIKNAVKNIPISSSPDNTLTNSDDGLFVPAKFSFNVVTTDLISSDPNNDLQLGSDNKLLSKPQDVDFLAYFILAKG